MIQVSPHAHMLRPLSGEKKSNTHLLRPHNMDQLTVTTLQSLAKSAGHYTCDKSGTYSVVSSSRHSLSMARDGAPQGCDAYAASPAACAIFFVLELHPLDNTSLNLILIYRRAAIANDNSPLIIDPIRQMGRTSQGLRSTTDQKKAAQCRNLNYSRAP